MKKIFLLVFLISTTAFAQENFEIKDASKNYDVTVEVEKCDSDFCKGKATFSIFKKGISDKPFQIIKFDDTEFMFEEGKLPKTKKLYDYQSIVFFEDYNFDGADDIAIRDGKNGGYGGPSYQIYLFSPQTRKFFNSPTLTDLAQGEYLVMFNVSSKTKTLQTFAKSGCCWHQTREFRVINNRPQKILEITEDATVGSGDKEKVTTRKLVNGRWKSTVKYEKIEK